MAFSIFSDIHTHLDDTESYSTLCDTLETMKAVHEKCDIDGLFFLGDGLQVCATIRLNAKIRPTIGGDPFKSLQMSIDYLKRI